MNSASVPLWCRFGAEHPITTKYIANFAVDTGQSANFDVFLAF
jgi:hypothetical protein